MFAWSMLGFKYFVLPHSNKLHVKNHHEIIEVIYIKDINQLANTLLNVSSKSVKNITQAPELHF